MCRQKWGPKNVIEIQFMNRLEDTKKVADLNARDYDAIYLAGGHGKMFDFRQSKDLEYLIAKF